MSPQEFIKRYKRQFLFHFTDLRNLPSIRKHGLLSLHELVARGIKPPKPGGNELSHVLDKSAGLDKYVHLCMIENHPMEYVARANNHIGETKFLRIASEVLLAKDVMACDVVANKSDAEVLPLAEALDKIDCEILFSGKVDFSVKEQKERYNAAKRGEILIPREIALKYIRNLD